MSKTNQTQKKHAYRGAVAAILAAALVGAAALSGCGSGEEASKKPEVSVVTGTENVTTVINDVLLDDDGNPVTDPNGSYVHATTAPATTAPQTTAKADNKKQATTAPAQTSKTQTSKTQTSKTQTSTPQNNSSDGRQTTPAGAKESPVKTSTKEDSSAKALTVGGKSYKVGDKVTCTYYLMLPNTMLNFQGRVLYDPAMLKKTNAYLVEPANFSSVINTGLEGKVVFNGSDLQGYDFTSPGYAFLVVEYEALKTGVTEPAINFEFISDISDVRYSGGEGSLTNGAKVWAVYE